jgi:hypothetical protein
MAGAIMGRGGSAIMRVFALSIEPGASAQEGPCIRAKAAVVGREGDGKAAPANRLLPSGSAYPRRQREKAIYEKRIDEGEAMRIAKAMADAPSFEAAMEIAREAGVCRENGDIVYAVETALELLGANGRKLAENLKESMVGAKLPVI